MSTTSAQTGRGNVDALLRRFPVLAGFREDDARRLIAAGERYSLGVDERVFDEDEAAERVYLLLDGEVVLRRTPRGDVDEVDLRTISAGEAFGLEAAFGAPRRHAHAAVTRDAEVLELTSESVARAVRRAGAGDASRLERAVRRQLTDELLRTMSFTGQLPDSERELLLDMVRRRVMDKGEVIYRQRQQADAMFLVASGMVRLLALVGGERHVRAYLSAGDFFGEEETLAGESWRLTAEAVSRCELLVIPREHLRTLTARNPGLLQKMQRISWGRQDTQARVFDEIGAQPSDGEPEKTRHLIADVYRAAVATELLAIDLDRCVTCGTCAWSCHQTHGQARLVRRGDKVLVPGSAPSLVDLAETGGRDAVALDDGRRLLLPNSCQHCRDPECMVDCPTGAIGRDPAGEVFINPATCVGCENCAKRCPWDNIQIAPAPKGPGVSVMPGVEQVAVKCDLCRDYEGAGACVSNCPTGAIFRLDPQEESAPLRALLGLEEGEEKSAGNASGSGFPAWTPAALIAAAAAAMSAAGVVGHAREALTAWGGAGLVAGVVALLVMLGLGAYGARKRGIGRWMSRRRASREAGGGSSSGRGLTPLSTWYSVHLLLGGALIAAFFVHSGGRLGGALTAMLGLATLGAVGFGALGGLLYKWVPRRLSRIVASPHLPEDRDRERQRLELALRDVLSGQADAKAAAGRVLAPRWRGWAHWRFLFSARDRHTLYADLLEQADLSSFGTEDDAAYRRAAALTTELLGLEAERLGQRLLSFWLLPHLILSAAAFILALVHATLAFLMIQA